VMEASYVGLPVVSSKIGGIPEIISHGENGYLVENNSIGEYKKYLEILINDVQTRKMLSDNAIRISRSRFSKDKIEEKLDELYQDCFRKK